MTSKYSNGVFGCFSDIQTCVTGTVCPCWLNGMNYAVLRGEQFDCMHCCAIHHPFWVRRDVEKKENDEVNKWIDCAFSWFCAPCMICQDARALGSFEKAKKQVAEVVA